MTPIEIVADHVTKLFNAGLWIPSRLTCPTERLEAEITARITSVLSGRGIPIEVVNLRPAPTDRLDALTQRLWEPNGGDWASKPGPTGTLLVVSGIELLAGENDAPTYPFRSRFQFDEQYMWLFVIRDQTRAALLFANHAHPLYRAATDITPNEWRIKPPTM